MSKETLQNVPYGSIEFIAHRPAICGTQLSIRVERQCLSQWGLGPCLAAEVSSNVGVDGVLAEVAATARLGIDMASTNPDMPHIVDVTAPVNLFYAGQPTLCSQACGAVSKVCKRLFLSGAPRYDYMSDGVEVIEVDPYLD